METITLYGVDNYRPDDLIVALQRRVQTRSAQCEARRVGDRLQVTVCGQGVDLSSVTESVVQFYASWRRAWRDEA